MIGGTGSLEQSAKKRSLKETQSPMQMIRG
jgi:hypothetical protein